jgi:hypothetical protein
MDNPAGMDRQIMIENKIKAEVLQSMLNCHFVNRRFQVQAAFGLYSVFTTVVFGFTCPKCLIYLRAENISCFHTNRSTFAGDRAVMAI